MSKANKYLFWVLKLLLLFVLVYIIYLQLVDKNINIGVFYNFFVPLSFSKYKYLFLFIVLFFLNWLLESLKWKYLVNKIQSFNFFTALKSVLLGVFFGFITPNRIGEFGGRLFFIYKGNKLKALNLSFIGGLAQFIVTFLFGLFFTVRFLIIKFNIFQFLLVIIFLLSSVTSLLIYFNLNNFIKKIKNIKFLQRFANVTSLEIKLSSLFLLKIFLVTISRYIVYTLQYVFILHFLGLDLSFLFLFQIISIMFLIQTILPSFALLDIGIRGNVLLFLLSNYTDNQLAILISVFLVWILNLVIPAVVGYLNFVNLKMELKDEKFNISNNNSF